MYIYFCRTHNWIQLIYLRHLIESGLAFLRFYFCGINLGCDDITRGKKCGSCDTTSWEPLLWQMSWCFALVLFFHCFSSYKMLSDWDQKGRTTKLGLYFLWQRRNTCRQREVHFFLVAVSREAACLRAAPRVYRNVSALCKRPGEYFMSRPSKPRQMHMHVCTAGQAWPNAGERWKNGRGDQRNSLTWEKKNKNQIKYIYTKKKKLPSTRRMQQQQRPRMRKLLCK